MSKRITLCAVACLAAVAVAACGGGPTPTSPVMEFEDAGQMQAAAKLPKLDICHLTGNGSYNKININGNALASHQAHGDLFPGTPPLNDACVVEACATFDNISVGGLIFLSVSWEDTVNGTDSYIVEQLVERGGVLEWQQISSAPVPHNSSGSYSDFVVAAPDAIALRIVASCGVVSAEFPPS